MSSGEFELIDKIRQYSRGGKELRLGIGDDCSVLEVPTGYDLLTSTDLLLENTHFHLGWTDFVQLGQKAVAVNVSDISAMGGRPLALYLGLGLPTSVTTEQVEQFMAGFHMALQDFSVFLAGGDTCRSRDSLTIAITVQGICPAGRKVTRSGAGVGEDLWVSGTLGDSALALKHYQAGRTPSPFLRSRHLTPKPPVALGLQLSEQALATAMLDLSDGLAGDLRHLVSSSGVGARVDLSLIPLSEEFTRAMKGNSALVDLALGGGEDYELLFTALPDNRERIEALSAESGVQLSRIGQMTAEPGIYFFTVGGERYQPRKMGYDHFARTSGEQRD